MELPVNRFFTALTRQLRSRTDFPPAVDTMLQWCAKAVPHGDWRALRAFDYERELKNAQRWLPGVVRAAPSPFPVRGLYCGLAEMATADGREYADLYVGFLGQYSADDAKRSWVFGRKRHYPDSKISSFRTPLLKRAGLMFNRTGKRGLGGAGNYAFPLIYSTLLVKALLTPELFAVLGGKRRPVGVMVGWDSGDYLQIGELTATGFAPNPGKMI